MLNRYLSMYKGNIERHATMHSIFLDIHISFLDIYIIHFGYPLFYFVILYPSFTLCMMS